MKISRPVLYGGIAVLGIAAWMLTGEDAARKSSTTKPKPAASTKIKGIVYLKEDYENRYARLNHPTPNAFKPIVARVSGGAELLGPNQIPADMAGGDPNWVFNGMASVDGIAMGLVENGSTGDGEFVKIHQKWKRATVLRITPDTLVLESERGVVRTVRIKTEDDLFALPEMGGGLVPVNPLQGPIGGDGMAVRPDAVGPSSSTPPESNNEN